MATISCAKCGARLSADDKSCPACGEPQAQGQPGGRMFDSPEEEQLWVRSVEEAKRRRAAAAEVDPDEVLRRVVEQQGSVAEVERLARRSSTIADDDRRTEYPGLRKGIKALLMSGIMLAVLFAVTGFLLLGVLLTTSLSSMAIAIAGITVIILMGASGVTVYWSFRFCAESLGVIADIGDNSRRIVVLLRRMAPPAEQERTKTEKNA